MTYTAIPDTDVDAESPVTTTLMTLMRDNPIAITQGDAGAPNIIAAALATDSVETAKIKALNVTAAKLAVDSVETAKIKALNVTAAKLATDSVETAKIKDSAVTNAKIGPLAVTPFKIATDAVETAKIKDLNVTTAKLNTAAITKAKLDVTVHRVLFSNVTEVGNVGSGEDDLMSYTMPISTLLNNGSRLRITAYFKGQGAKLVELKFRFGGTALPILLVGTPAAIAPTIFSFRATVDVVRLSVSSQAASFLAHDQGGLIDSLAVAMSEALESGSVVVKFTGENRTDAVDNAIVQQYMQVEMIPA